MNTPTGPKKMEEVLDHVAVLFELSLEIGTSLDLDQNNSAFICKLKSRFKLDLCAVFIQQSRLTPNPLNHADTEGESPAFVASFSSPELPLERRVVHAGSALVQQTQRHGAVSGAVSDCEDLAPLALAVQATRGFFASFKAGSAAWILMIAKDRSQPHSDWELNQLKSIFEKFSHSLEACLGHQDLLNETAMRMALQERLARAERLESLGLLAGGVAHDLNNLLGPLVGYPGMILAELPQDSPFRSDLCAIENAAKQASDVITDLLVLARQNSRDRGRVVLTEAVHSYLESASFRKIRGVYPRVHFDHRLQTHSAIRGTDSPVTRIIMNLLTNAFEEVALGGRVGLTVRDVVLAGPLQGYDFIPAGKYSILEVVDNGRGISQDHLDQVFEPFFSTKRQGASGTGLGLAIVYRIVKDLGGFVDIRTGAEGTRFSLYFPTIKAGPAVDMSMPNSLDPPRYPLRHTATGRSSKDSDALDVGVQPPSVLVIEEQTDQLKQAMDWLDESHVQAIGVSTQADALASVQKHLPSVVLVDVDLAEGSGIDLYRELLALKPDLECVLCCSRVEPEVREEGIRLGAKAFLTKPYKSSELRHAVSKFTGLTATSAVQRQRHSATPLTHDFKGS